MKNRNTSAVWIFAGALLTVFFVVGLLYEKNPGTFLSGRRVDVALEQFVAFCGAWYLPCGIIGIPMLLVSLIISLVRESKDK